jgi:carbon storage regulator
MLVLTRKVGQEVAIGANIRLRVLLIKGNQVRLGFTAPEDILVRRAELADRADRSSEQDPGPPDLPRRRRP